MLNYLTFKIRDKSGNKFPADTAYMLLKPNGEISRGILGEEGMIQTIPSENPEEYVVIVDHAVSFEMQQADTDKKDS